MSDSLEKSEKLIDEIGSLLEWLKKTDTQESRKTRNIFRTLEELKGNVSELIAEVLRKNPTLAGQLILHGSGEDSPSNALKRGRPSIEGSRKSALSSFLVEWRTQMKLSQAKLQERLGIDLQQYVSKIESGSILVPNDDFLQKLSVLTGKTFEELKKMATDRGV